MENSEHSDRKEIRRPMNAFLIFCKRHRSMVREKNPHLDNRSVTRILGELWANLNDQEKTVYTDLAKQYKEAFMKANPDYKWHNPEKICSVAIKPIVVKPPTLLRGAKNVLDSLSSDGIVPGKLADPSNMGGLNLLLMAGEQSLAPKSQSGEQDPAIAPQTGEPDRLPMSSGILASPGPFITSPGQLVTSARPAFTSPGQAVTSPGQLITSSGHGQMKEESTASQENTALLELAEMCSTQLVDSSKVVSLQGVKLERVPSTENTQVPVLSSSCSQSPMTGSSNLVPSPVISSATTNSSKSSAHCPACKTSSRSANQLLYSLIAEKPEVCLLPKENNNEEQKESRHVHEPDKPDGSDQVMSCDKVVVNHIIDQLFTRDSSAQIAQKPLACEISEKRMSHSQVEAVVKERLKAMSAPQSIEECMTKIITEAYATQIQGDLCRDKQRCEQPVVSKSNSENSLMSQMLRTGTYRTPGKVSQESKESVMKSPPSLHTSSVSAVGTRFVKPDPVVWGKSMEARMRLPKKRPYPGDIDCSDSYVSDDGQISPMVSPNPSTAESVLSPVCSDTASSTSPRYDNIQYSSTLDCSGSNKWSEVLSKDYDKMESNNSRATRKSKRRNRGQRYMELINEGIIQPSKERLAAIRTESLSSVDDSDDEWKIEIGEESSCQKSRGDNDRSDSEHSRYKSGDFDLEAHIATLPPCSMDSLSRKKRRHASGGNQNNNNNNNSSSSICGHKSSSQSEGGDVEVSLTRPPHVKLTDNGVEETVTGSRKRKARKHKITHLIAVQPGSAPAAEVGPRKTDIVAEEQPQQPCLQNQPFTAIKDGPSIKSEKRIDFEDNISVAVRLKDENVAENALVENISLDPVPANFGRSVTLPFPRTATSYKSNIVVKECKKFDIYEFSEDSEELESSPSLAHHGYSDKPFGVSPRKVQHRLVPKQVE
ncbi:HMG box transcription factor BBX-like [Liolophura sinensis]|uniref:HMG box transcription factor BBX-like n=1 Tax=Liolophura sinensis TaxID=3198878 RepID=UPI00315811D8